MLIDNGSTRADAAVQLRHIASKLSRETQQLIHPVSMQHSDKINPTDILEKLDDQPAQVFKSFMRQQLETGQRNFILIPLFFGKSRALTSFVPDTLALLEDEFGAITLKITDVLYPLPDGNSILIDILYEHAHSLGKGKHTKNLVLVDHGSPIPSVTAVRQHIAESLSDRLENTVTLQQAAMERRKGKEYDFNGELLEDYLSRIAESGETEATVLLLFLLPGTHAGENGDIAQICRSVMLKHPHFTVSISPLIGQNEKLISCLAKNLNKVLDRD